MNKRLGWQTVVLWLACLVIIVAAIVSWRQVQPRAKLSIQSNPLKVARQPLSGESVQIDVMLVKSGNAPVEIIGVTTACGCTEFSVDGVGTLSDSRGFTMTSRTARCKVTIDTTLQRGWRRFAYQVRYRQQGAANIAEIKGGIDVQVLNGIVLQPDRIRVPSSVMPDPVFVDVLDDLPDSHGVPILCCEVSDDRVLKAVLLPPRGEATGGDKVLTRRHQLRIDWLDVPVANSRHWIKVVPAIPGALVAQIPIIVSGAGSQSSYLDPPELVIVRCLGEPSTTRTVAICSRDGGSASAVAVARFPPELCCVTVDRGRDLSECVAKVNILAQADGDFDIEFDLLSGDRLRLPVSILCPGGRSY